MFNEGSTVYIDHKKQTVIFTIQKTMDSMQEQNVLTLRIAQKLMLKRYVMKMKTLKIYFYHTKYSLTG